MVGYLFASIALLVGSFFFIYSIRYYLTLAVVLSFSRHSSSKEEDSLIVGENKQTVLVLVDYFIRSLVLVFPKIPRLLFVNKFQPNEVAALSHF